MAKEVTRHVAEATKCFLWGRAAGRCEFAGCNATLWKSQVTQEPVNRAQKAHIYSYSKNGPRGNEPLDLSEINDLSNLMLVCHQCHQTIDKDRAGVKYSAELLSGWKACHERRIEIVTGIDPTRSSHVLLYGANIGMQSSPLSFDFASKALFPDRYPAEDRPIGLSTVNSSFLDRDVEFWSFEKTNLRRKFDQRVRERLADGSIQHMSVFALAPQPLLILLGTLLSDINQVDVFQLSREPQGWKWQDGSDDLKLIVEEPTQVNGPPALILSLSATIVSSRITTVLGGSPTIWRVSIREPHNDLLRSRSQLREFRHRLRRLMDRMKFVHGQDALLHIFPAAPVSIAVELGRIRQPKADMSWRIYDQVNGLGGFVPALEIGTGETV